MPRKKLTAEQVALKYGFRSGLEEAISKQLNEKKIDFTYESIKIPYVQPEKKRSYTPDFLLKKKDGTRMIIETKGRFTLQDRQKMMWIKNQYPELDIRILFTNSRTKISKGAKSSYADWCKKYGYIYADKVIPDIWLDELGDN